MSACSLKQRPTSITTAIKVVEHHLIESYSTKETKESLVAGCAARQLTYVPSTREGAPYSRAVWVGDTLYLSGDGAPHVLRMP